MTGSPYKLLDYYRFEDAGIFFGREEETRQMVGEILTSRLLVLFSPSGSGKTSLINAGVRPRLEEMGYKTIYTRMEDEPIISVCRAASQALDIPDRQEKEELYEYLKKAAQAAGKPLVIFLDQFEEFFIVFRDQKELRQEFARQAARVKYDDQLPVFLVLSLREDYFANLHEFRAHIPSIFQNNTNIRLEPFSAKAARRAIEEPLKTVGYQYEPGLVETLIKDLKTGDGGIEPIKAQLVCSTLWKHRPADTRRIPLSTYEDLGGAEKISSHFIHDGLSKIPGRLHPLMVRIFESLKTQDNTKRYRSFEDIQTQLNIKKAKKLEQILYRLSKIDILRREEHGGAHWYEFKHDYVLDDINSWIKERKERINRKRLFYAVLPGIILFISLFTYLFIQYNTFYAGFTSKDYDDQLEEIVISRGIDPFGERININTGILIYEVKDLPTINDLRTKIRISFWNKNNWYNLAGILPVAESGEFLYKIGRKKIGINKLIDALKKNDKLVSVKAATSLVRLGKADKTVIEALFQKLKDKNSFVRFWAAVLLVTLDKADQTVIEVLLLAMKDKDDYLRFLAAISLIRHGKANQTVIETLLKALKDKDSNMRRQAAISLGRLDKADHSVIETLLQALKDEDYIVQEVTIDSLARLGKRDQTVIEALLYALKDEDSDVREKAFDSLGRLEIADKNVIEALLKSLKDGDSDVRRHAVDSLGKLGKEDKTVIEALLQALKDENSWVRIKAADYLARLGKADQSVIKTLLQILKDESSLFRLDAADSLIRLGRTDKTVINVVLQALKDRDGDYYIGGISASVRRHAAESLGKLVKADKTVIEALLKALKDEDSDVRKHAVDSLGKLENTDKTVIEALLQTMKDEKYSVRQQAAISLGKLGKADKTVIEALILALEDEEPGVRGNVADSLGRLGKKNKKVIEALIPTMKDESFYVRRKAADSLGILWQNKSQYELLQMLEDTRSEYRTGAAYALKHKESLSPGTIEEIIRLKDTDNRPWVRLGAWKAFELLQEKKEKEKEKEQNKDQGQ